MANLRLYELRPGNRGNDKRMFYAYDYLDIDGREWECYIWDWEWDYYKREREYDARLITRRNLGFERICFEG